MTSRMLVVSWCFVLESAKLIQKRSQIPTVSPCKGVIALCIGHLIFHPPSSILSISHIRSHRSLQTMLIWRINPECDNNYGDILLAAPHRGYQAYPGRLCRSISPITSPHSWTFHPVLQLVSLSPSFGIPSDHYQFGMKERNNHDAYIARVYQKGSMAELDRVH